jgi:hypothetical protein
MTATQAWRLARFEDPERCVSACTGYEIAFKFKQRLGRLRIFPGSFLVIPGRTEIRRTG